MAIVLKNDNTNEVVGWLVMVGRINATIPCKSIKYTRCRSDAMRKSRKLPRGCSDSIFPH